ncbi:FAD-dependent oxidoreductase [Promethearchaeum syntrophicum]|uniref:FAD-dependent oxidoreductase n=1 Tax=Promethearchaeum syntrophicum TaxID=2594042 RepID=A0A5B9DBL3_9ARCH|nr:FAD-dependent oxidoreductase [Candidatus Prometheoarchaeum syntrophicum]QEE16568.1 dihydropyrimidine dehydrogenase subunit A [Candidatus Prometheoarchaeum syntrophicum]
MDLHSINSHPILPIPEQTKVSFTFDGKELVSFKNMMISSALFMNGIKIFGHHFKDGSPQGIFCANGQCAQCTVIVNGAPMKACMTPLKEEMVIESCNDLPELPAEDTIVNVGDAEILETEVLVIGAGPAGLSASKLLGESNVKVILIDDKDRTGGKLVLQTHKFFGSQKDVYAGKRGIHIGQILGEEVRKLSSVEIWLNSTALAVFRDGFVGILKENSKYVLIKPKNLLIATGAREKMLIFPGDTLPGVYGAGAFQTLVNRDLVKPAEKIFIVGGGNVGLIAGYHAIQADIKVVGLIEALPKCGGYYVHETKLRRLGVPIYTRHTIISANGTEEVKSITIGQLDDNWNVIPGTEKTFACDTILIAVGLNPVNEFYLKAQEFGIDSWVAGDAQEIAEASAAIFTGRIEAIKILKEMGIKSDLNLSVLEEKAKMMKAHPSPPGEHLQTKKDEGAFPIFHCYQEIPCNPCTTVCPQDLIETVDNSLTTLPFFNNNQDCIACGRCVAVCPGLAVTLVDTRKDAENPIVTFPYEISAGKLEKGQEVTVLDDSTILGNFPIHRVRILKEFPQTQLVSVALPKDLSRKAVGIRAFKPNLPEPMELYHKKPLPDEIIVCRCERVTAGEIRDLIKKGITDVNQIKAITRAGMGACGAKTCGLLIDRLFREEGISQEKITESVKRPLFVEVPLKYFASVDEGDDN